MEPVEAARWQKILRGADENISKQLQMMPDFSSEPTSRKAYRKARSLGHLKYIYGGKIYGTRLKTESHTEHLEAMLQKAEEHMGAEMLGAPEEALAPMEESKKTNKGMSNRLFIERSVRAQLKDKIMKINKDTLKNLVREEVSKISEAEPIPGLDYRHPEELEATEKRDKWWRRKKRKQRRLRKTKPGRSVYRARGWVPKGDWPSKAGARFVQWKGDQKDGVVDDRASFNAFYKEVLKSPEAMKLLRCRDKKCRKWRRGGMDYHWGDQHAQAYAAITNRAVGGTKVTDKEAAEITKGVAPAGKGGAGGGGRTEKTELIRKMEGAQHNIDTARRKKTELAAEMKKIADVTWSKEVMPEKARIYNLMQKKQYILSRKIKNYEKLYKIYTDQIAKLDSPETAAKT